MTGEINLFVVLMIKNAYDLLLYGGKKSCFKAIGQPDFPLKCQIRKALSFRYLLRLTCLFL